MLDQFVSTYNGKPVDVDHFYGAQCWDLVELYAEQLGVPKEPWAITLGPQISAKEAWTVFDKHMQKYFDKIPKGQEQKGDILVYDGHGIYTEGHIAICLGGGQVFEQNADPDGSVAHTYARANTYLLGALRIKGEPMVTEQDVNNLIPVLTGKAPTTKSYGFVGKSFHDFVYGVLASEDYKAFMSRPANNDTIAKLEAVKQYVDSLEKS